MREHRKGDRVGQFVILRVLARGGMGTVYEARPLVGNGHVVLKVAEGQGADFLKDEAEHLAALDHPDIVKALPVLEVDGQEYYAAREPDTNEWYIALEYFDGGSLADRLKSEGKLNLQETLAIAQQIGSALEYAHARGIVHGDIKPSNVLFQRVSDGSLQAALSDFGVTMGADGAGSIARAATLPYASPEQLDGGKRIDRRSDVYSLGVVLYQTLTGHLPFEARTDEELMRAIQSQPPQPPSRLVSTIPPEVDRVILKALRKRPEERFQTVEEMVEALTRAVRA